MKIDIEKLMYIVFDEFDYYTTYKTYRITHPEPIHYDEYKKWQNEYSRIYQSYEAASDKVYDIRDLFNMNTDKLYIAARAYRKWQEKTHFEKCMPDKMAKKIGDWIFETESKTHFDIEEEDYSKRYRHAKECYCEYVC